ncbi:uncharacterized protein K452DRAFT_49623 [Aplosporella prunicola CBS 121167]|uniref:Uncharacterized protein n=1 Tax=Aplosporella prunicola CBS 121167 TaxID=1176127 RepID=A0A6A6B9C7_9PEZI|nr:uncharacterized protein K452DRAFT_49623 [Aplosporella prunicola CBS 121167]KAF2140660.1 hypothetical protein K452DRAFT_49623 [Aplosporella prunicola CBS 121167]
MRRHPCLFPSVRSVVAACPVSLLVTSYIASKDVLSVAVAEISASAGSACGACALVALRQQGRKAATLLLRRNPIRHPTPGRPKRRSADFFGAALARNLLAPTPRPKNRRRSSHTETRISCSHRHTKLWEKVPGRRPPRAGALASTRRHRSNAVSRLTPPRPARPSPLARPAPAPARALLAPCAVPLDEDMSPGRAWLERCAWVLGPGRRRRGYRAGRCRSPQGSGEGFFSSRR